MRASAVARLISARLISSSTIKELKHDLAIRPVFHQREERIEAHIFVAFVAYCLHVTLKHLARPCAPGLTPRAVLEKFSTLQMVDVHLPTTDGRHLGRSSGVSPSAARAALVCFTVM